MKVLARFERALFDGDDMPVWMLVGFVPLLLAFVALCPRRRRPRIT